MTGDAASDAPRIVTLTLSPARDLTIDVDTIDLGTSHRVAQAGGRLGGKGINVARVLAALGRPVYVQGPMNAADWPETAGGLAPPRGPAALATPAAPASAGAGPNASGQMPGQAVGQPPEQASGGSDEGLLWDLIPTPAQLRRSYALVESSGRATLFNEQASEHPAEVWAEIEEKLRLRLVEPQVRALAISGSTPRDLPDGFVGRVVSAAHAAGVTVVVDTSGPALIAAAEAGADWLKPNLEELAEIAAADDTSPNDDQTSTKAQTVADPVDGGTQRTAAVDVAAAAGPGGTAGAVGTAVVGPEDRGARALIAAGAGAVLVSRGEDGLVLIDRTGLRSSAKLDEPVQGNPTGAGDAVVAALLNQLTADPDSGADDSTRLRGYDDSPATAADRVDGILTGAEVDAVLTDAGVDKTLTDAEVESILTDAVAVSAAAVLMPQAGAIHPSWTALRDHVQITSPAAPTDLSPSAVPAAPTSPPPSAAPAAPPADDTAPADHLGERPPRRMRP